MQRHFQGGNHQPSPDRHVGHVSHPQLIDACGFKFTLDQIGRCLGLPIPDKYTTLQIVTALVICINWHQLCAPDFPEMDTRMFRNFVIDSLNLYQPNKLKTKAWTSFSGGSTPI